MKETNNSQSLPLIMEENGKRYRMLQVGETIEEGDEVASSGTWYKMHGCYNGIQISDPLENEAFPQGYYRRPITDHPENDPVNVAAAILEAGK